MDISLQKMLVLISIYGLAGVFFLNSARIANTKIEQFCSGLVLIIHASFLLAVIGHASTSLTDLASHQESTVYVREQVQEFIPIIVFMSGIFTFLFGGVGTNLVSASFSVSDNSEVISYLEKLEARVDSIEKTIRSRKRSSFQRIFANVIVLVVVLVGIYSQL
ncbi:hypothetical protein ATY37_20000 [Vibrio cidicii]|uniref:Uncharacterized protein n=1 Tax=Vibrio cidicii TaxID=1763883 RepID=A0A151KUG9_9VIBR|nr:hypothetical protein [Vibrio cidicii]KYN84997.1 hypothetical protein ATY37_20000 [Vibrio cidicii]